jgi:Mn2+/Fe2+ NRAMP family transporter
MNNNQSIEALSKEIQSLRRWLWIVTIVLVCVLFIIFSSYLPLSDMLVFLGILLFLACIIGISKKFDSLKE